MKRRSLIPLVAAVLGTLCCAPDQSGNPGGESPEQPAEEGVRIRVLAGPRYMDVLAPFEI